MLVNLKASIGFDLRLVIELIGWNRLNIMILLDPMLIQIEPFIGIFDFRNTLSASNLYRRAQSVILGIIDLIKCCNKNRS